jgi:hypothetical protein
MKKDNSLQHRLSKYKRKLILVKRKKGKRNE